MMNKILLAIISFLLVSGCYKPDYEKPVLGGSKKPPEIVDFQIIPIEGFPNSLALRLEKDLENELNLKARVSVHMGTSKEMYSNSQNQYVTSAIAKEALEISKHINRHSSTPYTIVLTHYDINDEPFNLRFLFAQHSNNISIVSIARMDPRAYGGQYNKELVYSRMKKLVKKGIGLEYYGYKLSTNKGSVMYAPIMSLRDLDEIGSDYL